MSRSVANPKEGLLELSCIRLWKCSRAKAHTNSTLEHDNVEDAHDCHRREIGTELGSNLSAVSCERVGQPISWRLSFSSSFKIDSAFSTPDWPPIARAKIAGRPRRTPEAPSARACNKPASQLDSRSVRLQLFPTSFLRCRSLSLTRTHSITIAADYFHRVEFSLGEVGQHWPWLRLSLCAHLHQSRLAIAYLQRQQSGVELLKHWVQSQAACLHGWKQ